MAHPPSNQSFTRINRPSRGGTLFVDLPVTVRQRGTRHIFGRDGSAHESSTARAEESRGEADSLAVCPRLFLFIQRLASRYNDIYICIYRYILTRQRHAFRRPPPFHRHCSALCERQSTVKLRNFGTPCDHRHVS